SEIIQGKMELDGVKLYLNRKVTEIKEKSNSGEVSSVKLDDDTVIPCQIVVVATGIRPNVGFLQNTPLKIDQGIIVNEYLETSVPNIYAAGDVAQPHDIIHDKNSVMANLPNASEQGRIAGANLAGQQISYHGGLSMTVMRYFGIPFVSMGELSKLTPKQEEISVLNQDMSIYRKLVMLNTRPIGAVIVGDIDQAGIINHLIHNKIDIPNPQDLLERKIKFETFRKNLMKEEMEGKIQWKKTIGREEPWRKDRAKIPVTKDKLS
ncbi:MAG: NAD(P)/FAD-dependent oxidoreductase, partial [Promethearchaeota archaeon]